MEMTNTVPVELKRFKRYVLAILILLPLYSLIMSGVFKGSYISLSTQGELIWIGMYLALLVFGFRLPSLAPQYIRFIGSDGSLFYKAARKRKDSWLRIILLPRGKLSLNITAEDEAAEVLDEREQAQRHKALAFSHRITFFVMIFGLVLQSDPVKPMTEALAKYFISGTSLGVQTLTGPFYSASSSMYLMFFVIITHHITPSAYLAWHYKPLAAD